MRNLADDNSFGGLRVKGVHVSGLKLQEGVHKPSFVTITLSFNKLNLLCKIDSSSVKPYHIPSNQTLYLLGYICALCKIMPNKNMLCYLKKNINP